LHLRLKESSSKVTTYEISWKLKENFEKIKNQYKILENWSKKDYSKQKNKAFFEELYYYEYCLMMLKAEYGILNVRFDFYLEVATLEYEFFIINKENLPTNYESDVFNTVGYCSSPKFNLIVNNLIYAQNNVEKLIEKNKINWDEKDLFIYYEILGDTYITLYVFLKKFQRHLKDEIEQHLYYGYYFYKVSEHYKNEVERANPNTYYDGIHGLPTLGVFIEFYEDIGLVDIHNVKKKISHLDSCCIKEGFYSKFIQSLKGESFES